MHLIDLLTRRIESGCGGVCHNYSTPELHGQGSQGQSQAGLHREFEANLNTVSKSNISKKSNRSKQVISYKMHRLEQGMS